MIARTLMAVALLTGAGLAGCGKTGELERPAPLFGAQAKADYDAQKRKQAADRAAAAEARKDNKVAMPDDATSQPLTQAPYATPIPGQSSNPFGHGPQGALPGPGNANNQ